MMATEADKQQTNLLTNPLLKTKKIVKQGYMYKTPPLNRLKSKSDWRRRFFTLLDVRQHNGIDSAVAKNLRKACQKDNGDDHKTGTDAFGYCLAYWKNENIQNSKPIRIIPLQNAVVSKSQDDNNGMQYFQFYFVISTESRKFFLACETDEECLSWVDALQNVLLPHGQPVYESLYWIKRNLSNETINETNENFNGNFIKRTNEESCFTMEGNNSLINERDDENMKPIETNTKTLLLNKNVTEIQNKNRNVVSRRNTHDAVFPLDNSPPPLPPRRHSKYLPWQVMLPRPNLSEIYDDSNYFANKDCEPAPYATMQEILERNTFDKFSNASEQNNDELYETMTGFSQFKSSLDDEKEEPDGFEIDEEHENGLGHTLVNEPFGMNHSSSENENIDDISDELYEPMDKFTIRDIGFCKNHFKTFENIKGSDEEQCDEIKDDHHNETNIERVKEIPTDHDVPLDKDSKYQIYYETCALKGVIIIENNDVIRVTEPLTGEIVEEKDDEISVTEPLTGEIVEEKDHEISVTEPLTGEIIEENGDEISVIEDIQSTMECSTSQVESCIKIFENTHTLQ